MKDHEQLRMARPNLRWLVLGALSLLVASSGCQQLALGPRSGAVERSFVRVAAVAIDQHTRQGQPSRIAFWVTNNGEDPVLLRGITPQSPTDEPVSWLQGWRTALAYDMPTDTITAAPLLPGADYHVTIYGGLLLPGETVEAQTTLVALDHPRATHRFRLDYLAAPTTGFGGRLYVSTSKKPPSTWTFKSLTTLDLVNEPSRLRRSLLAGGNQGLVAGSVYVKVKVTVEPSAPSLVAARERAGVSAQAPALHARALSGWVFPTAGGGVVVDADGVRELRHVSNSALRVVAGSHSDQVAIRADSPDVFDRLNLSHNPALDPPLCGTLPVGELAALLNLVSRDHLALRAERDRVTLPGSASTPNRLVVGHR